MGRYRCLTLAVSATFVLTVVAQPDAIKKDLAQLQGTWTLVSGVIDGKKMSAEAVKNARMVITGNKYQITAGVGSAEEGTFTLDPSKSPRWLNATPSVGPNKGKTWKGIYSVGEGIHRACLAPPGKDRPEKFASPVDSGILNQTWKKKKN